MGTSIQLGSGVIPRQFMTDSCFARSSWHFSFKNNEKVRRGNEFGYQRFKVPAVPHGSLSVYVVGGISKLYERKQNGSWKSLSCKCQRAQSVSEATVESGNGKLVSVVANGSNLQSFDNSHWRENEKEVSTSSDELAVASEMSDSLQEFGINSVEDEAWNLLRASIVYYCNNPIGTIAANDPSAANILNYDQIFIRDFIPSGIAFLLKGEYDIVRNFILHTLQLQTSIQGNNHSNWKVTL